MKTGIEAQLRRCDPTTFIKMETIVKNTDIDRIIEESKGVLRTKIFYRL